MIGPESLARALNARSLHEIPPVPGRTNHKRAPVLVPLRWGPGGAEVLLTERAATLRAHAGEVSFPGGKPEPGDADAWATAQREAHEEIGLDPSQVTCLGPLSHMPLGTSDFRLVPFVGAVDPTATLVPEPAEVQRLLCVQIEALLGLSHIDGIPFDLATVSGLSPIFEVSGAVVFGGTAHTLLELLQVVAAAAGREVPPLREGRYRWGGRRVERT